jgi:polysaccharide deacetylase 2 family uncharacterized protein YibQ
MPRRKRPARSGWIVPLALVLVLVALIAVIAGRRPPHRHHPIAALPPGSAATDAAPLETPAPAQTSAPEGVATHAPPAEPPSAQPSSAAPESPAPAASSGPKLALIIDDCGQWPEIERGFIALPIPLTLSVLPDVRFNHAIEHAAAAAGKGIMLHLPMETMSGMNPGPGKVTTEMDDAAIATQVQHDLDDVDLATGVNNHEGSKATADARVMNDVATVLARDDRFFIDSMTSSKSVAEATARAHGVRVAARDVFLDNHADVAYTEGQLRAAVAIAERTGSAIAIGHPRATTLEAVRALVPDLQAHGIDFVLVSSLVQ